ncbi:MAG: hypothetical protein MZV65_44165 [Chromatiales bacterium]|nr:hypothetical protein [Chromatiales bacterium]
MEQAFKFSARALDARTIEVRFDIADGYYLYKDKFKYAAEPGRREAGDGPISRRARSRTTSSSARWRPSATASPSACRWKRPTAVSDLKLTVTSQGCADIGVCYPPTPQSARISLAALSSPAGGAGDALLGERPQSSSAAAPAAGQPSSGDESSQLAHLLKNADFWLILTTFFGAGLLLALTPCVFPMIPILSGIIVGHGHNITKTPRLLSCRWPTCSAWR